MFVPLARLAEGMDIMPVAFQAEQDLRQGKLGDGDVIGLVGGGNLDAALPKGFADDMADGASPVKDGL